MRLRQILALTFFCSLPTFIIRAQPVHLGLPKDSIDILFPVSEKTDQSDDRRTYFDMLVDDVNWSGSNGRLRLKFDSVGKVKGFQWSCEMKPKEAKSFMRSLNKLFGPSKGDHLPKSDKDILSWNWDKVSGTPSAAYMFGTFSFLQGQTSNGKFSPPNDINANAK